MITAIKSHQCELCADSFDTYTDDGIFWFCNDSPACMERAKAFKVAEALTPYRNATPEKLKELETRRDKTKRKWERLVIQCRDMKAALGLDDTTFLTHTKLMSEMTEGDSEC